MYIILLRNTCSILFFVIVALLGFETPSVYGLEPESRVDEFLLDVNESIEIESDKKIQDANQAYKEGRFREARKLFREALYLSSLRIEEPRMTEEKILALKDQMTSKDLKFWKKRFMKEGDRLGEQGLYDLAVDEYEKVFLLDPANVKASKKIDRLRNRFIQEQKELLQEQDGLIDEEIERRVKVYLERVDELVEIRSYSQARRLLSRVLVLDPKSKQAKKKQKEIKRLLG